MLLTFFLVILTSSVSGYINLLQHNDAGADITEDVIKSEEFAPKAIQAAKLPPKF